MSVEPNREQQPERKVWQEPSRNERARRQNGLPRAQRSGNAGEPARQDCHAADERNGRQDGE